MRELDEVLSGWAGIDLAFSSVRELAWGGVIADQRFPHLLECNYARVSAREPIALAEVESALLDAAPLAHRLHVIVFFPDDQPDLIAEASLAGAELFFDTVLIAPREISDAGDVLGTVEEVVDFDAEFWEAHAATSAVFGIEDPVTLSELADAEREALIPHGKRWFVARGEDGGIEGMAALARGGSVAAIDHVAVLPSARGRGFGGALVAGAAAAAKYAGVETVYLLAEPDGPAERLYERLGFRPIATFAGWVRRT